ncbi:MAG TPA: amidase [Gemmatimonadaceae bacterium]|nr:amidase [Gemmatimonadaceae bacterium]
MTDAAAGGRYDLRHPDLPRVAGRSARMLASLIESRTLGPPILARLIRDAGISAFRSRELSEPPTGAPLWPVDGDLAEPGAVIDGIEELLALRPLTELPYSTIGDHATAYRTGSATPLAVAEAVLEAMRLADEAMPPLRAFLSIDRDDVLAQARESTRRFDRGVPRGPLEGVPVAIKDEVDQRGHPTTVGTSFLGRQPASVDAIAVARLRAAGALLIGKTNMHEVGIGVTGLNAHHGTARNPHDPERHTGGSSSGSAAAVASGLCPAALGADGGGSIRIPAALCGLVGLKPTYGRVSETGAFPLCWSVAHLGPIATTAADAALLHAILAGPDPADAATLRQPPVRVDDIAGGDLSGLVVGVYRPWFEDADPEIVAHCDRMIAVLVDAGARVREVEVPELELARIAHAVTIGSEMAAAMMSHRADRGRHGADVRINMAIARAFTARDYVHAQRARTRVMRHLAAALELADVVVTPATAIVAPVVRADALRGGESDIAVLSALMRFVSIANLTGHPAIAFPAGTTAKGLPIGMQAIGRPWEEHVLLRMARAAEAAVDRAIPRVGFRPLLEACGRGGERVAGIAQSEPAIESDSGEWYDRRIR